MEYKIAAFDFDGTLRAGSQPQINPYVVKTLKQLQKAGIPVVVATGRSFGGLSPKLLGGFRPDYYVCANGSQVLDSKGSPLYTRQMTTEEMYALVDFSEDYELPLGFTFTDAYYIYVGYETMRDFYSKVTGSGDLCRDGEDMDHHLVEMPYGAFTLMPVEYSRRFVEKYPHLDLQFFYYSDLAADIVHKDTNKAKGLEFLLNRLGLEPSQLVAAGDSGNDLEMLRYAGLGVAMGNADPAVKAVADRVCPSDEENGAAALCRQVFPQVFES